MLEAFERSGRALPIVADQPVGRQDPDDGAGSRRRVDASFLKEPAQLACAPCRLLGPHPNKSASLLPRRSDAATLSVCETGRCSPTSPSAPYRLSHLYPVLVVVWNLPRSPLMVTVLCSARRTNSRLLQYALMGFEHMAPSCHAIPLLECHPCVRSVQPGGEGVVSRVLRWPLRSA